MQDLGVEVVKVQVDMVTFLADAAPFADFHRHRARDHITRCKVLGGWRVFFHEALTIGVGEIATLPTRTLGDQTARAVNTGRVELNKFHVLKRQTCAQHHGISVTRTGMGGCRGEIGAAIATCCQDHTLCAETVHGAIIKLPRGHTATSTIIIHDQVHGEVLDEELHIIAQRLAVKCVQHGVAGPVCSRTCALSGAVTEFAGHTAEGALVDLAFIRTGERHAPVLKLIHSVWCVTHEIFDRVLVTEPV